MVEKEKEESSFEEPRSIQSGYDGSVIDGIDGEIGSGIADGSDPGVSGTLTVGDAVGEIDLAIPVS